MQAVAFHDVGNIRLVRAGKIAPATILTQIKPMGDAIEAFKAFDRRESDRIRVELHPQKTKGTPEGSEQIIHPPLPAAVDLQAGEKPSSEA